MRRTKRENEPTLLDVSRAFDRIAKGVRRDRLKWEVAEFRGLVADREWHKLKLRRLPEKQRAMVFDILRYGLSMWQKAWDQALRTSECLREEHQRKSPRRRRKGGR